MPVIGLRDLSRKTRDVVERLEHDDEPIVITRHGRPIAMLSRVPEDQTASVALAVAPRFVADRERAAQEIEAGEGEPATALLAEFEAEEGEEVEVGADAIEIPPSLVEQLFATVTESPSGAVVMSPREREHLSEYIAVLARSSILGVLERARTVNSNLLAEIVTEPAEAKEQEYVAKVRTLADAELFAQSSVEVK